MKVVHWFMKLGTPSKVAISIAAVPVAILAVLIIISILQLCYAISYGMI